MADKPKDEVKDGLKGDQIEQELKDEVNRLRQEIREMQGSSRLPRGVMSQPDVLDIVPDNVREVAEEPVEEPVEAEDNGHADTLRMSDELPASDIGRQYELYRDRVANVNAAIAEAYRRGRFMVVLWSIDEQNRINLSRHTHGFPREDFDIAIRDLRLDLSREGGPAPVRALPRASVQRPKPMDVMFPPKAEGPGQEG